MIDQAIFEERFRKMITLCSYPQNMNNAIQVETYYNELRYLDENVIIRAFRNIIKAPPNKLTLSIIMYHVQLVSPKKECSDWTGEECKDENCDRGLISEKIGKYSVLFRCTKCNSTKIKGIADHNDINIFNEKNKDAPKSDADMKPVEILLSEIG